MKALLLVLAFVCAVAQARPHEADPRVCTATPLRDPDHTISRSMVQRAHFIVLHPCPVNGRTTSACPGWAVDHVIPLACGGCDAPMNMQWLPTAIKSCAGKACKDRWERKIYCQAKP